MTLAGTPGLHVAIVSPFALYAGHHFEWTTKLAVHLSRVGVDLRILTTSGDHFYKENLPLASVTQISTKFLHKLGNLDFRRDSLLFKITQNLETMLCGMAAWTQSSRVSAIYWTDARHYAMLIFVLLMRRQRHVHIVMGGVPYSKLRPNRLLEKLYKRAFASGRLVFIAETDAIREEWKGIAGNHIRTIPFAIDSAVDIPSETTRTDFDIGADEFVCLMFGTHRADKDYATVVKAASISATKPFLLFAGPLISENDPVKILDRYQYSNAMTIIRTISEAEVAALFSLSDCAILPYAKDYEKGSAVLLQSCQNGVPVIATRSGHLQRFVDENNTGVCYESEDPHELARAIDYLAAIKRSNPDQWSVALTKCRGRFSWETLIEEHLKALFASLES